MPPALPLPPLAEPTVEKSDARDGAWLRAAATGDRVSFERLYLCHHPRLARFLQRCTARRELIDEVINETMWVVWRKAGEFRGESKVSTWITGIAYRCMLKALRDGVPAEELNESTLTPVEQAQAAAQTVCSERERELRDWVARGLKTLPDEQRVTLELAYFMGESCEDIASIMGCAVGTVKARMFHARVRLRSVLPALANQ